MMDGTPIEQNSLQRADYVDRPGWRGRSNFTDEQLREILQLALTRPTQLALHVVGDAETDRVLKMMEQLAPAATWRAKRVRIEHGDGIGTDVFEKVAQLGVVVIQNPTHLAIPPIAGKKMLDHEIVLKGFVNAGIPLALGSDGGVKEQNPFLNLMLAVLVPSDPSEAMTREQALTAYTSRRRLRGGAGKAPGTARAWFCRGPCRALSGCFDGADATAPGDDEPANDGRWRSDLRRCAMDVAPLMACPFRVLDVLEVRLLFYPRTGSHRPGRPRRFVSLGCQWTRRWAMSRSVRSNIRHH